jgi:uncharacterized protein (TIGR02145 family)
MLPLVMTGAASVNAQVIIGSASKDPHAGAILDLASGGQNDLGLLLPNVRLSVDATKFVLVPEGTPGLETLKQTANGMIVYNAAGKPAGPGLYVWDGNLWVPINNICPSPVYDAEGNDYSTGWFGATGCWMTQNLRITRGLVENTHYTYPGTDGEDAATRKSAWAGHEVYGLLYNWETATHRTGVTADETDADYDGNYQPTRGICPSGWHIPSDKEWKELVNVIDGDPISYSSESIENQPATKMKSETQVNKPTNGKSIAAIEGGFDALLTGSVNDKGASSYFGSYAIFWSNSSYAGSLARYMGLDCLDSRVSHGAYGKPTLLSVRCKKDN